MRLATVRLSSCVSITASAEALRPATDSAPSSTALWLRIRPARAAANLSASGDRLTCVAWAPYLTGSSLTRVLARLSSRLAAANSPTILPASVLMMV
ncbi:Uncharacterised protein [Bordetella pertussis]|nr:Uncharacterised protein [Bordetella pertussis]